jgi:YHS domain-containing protein
MACGRSIQGDLTYISKAEYEGKVIYFCSEYCLRAYRSDPHRFYTAHSRSRSGEADRCCPDLLYK